MATPTQDSTTTPAVVITQPNNLKPAPESSEPKMKLQSADETAWGRITTAGGDQVTIGLDGECEVRVSLAIKMCAASDGDGKALFTPLRPEDTATLKEWTGRQLAIDEGTIDRGPMVRVRVDPQMPQNKTEINLDGAPYVIQFDPNGGAVILQSVFDKLKTVMGGDGDAKDAEYEIFFEGEVSDDSDVAKAARELKEKRAQEAAAAAAAPPGEGDAPDEDDGGGMPPVDAPNPVADLISSFNAEEPAARAAAPDPDPDPLDLAEGEDLTAKGGADAQADAQATAGATAGATAQAKTEPAAPAAPKPAARKRKSA